MIAPKGRVVVNEQEIHTAGQHMLNLLAREDIHTLEVSLVDQARETIDFLATDLARLWVYNLLALSAWPARKYWERTTKVDTPCPPE